MRAAAFDVVVIGAGAAGLMCAATAGQRGRRVLVLDHGPEPGAKILISGGGRCNFTNLDTRPERFLSANPAFCISALRRYAAQDFVALIERHGIAYHEKTLGQLFCDGSARQVVAMLLAECAAAGVTLRLGTSVTAVERGERFTLGTPNGAIACASVVLATGGFSIPKLGASGFAYDVARRFGLALTAIAPALVPLTFDGPDLALMRGLSGVALPATASCGRARFAEAMLFTHRGLSGPAILQASSYWREGMPVVLDVLPGRDARAVLLAAKRDRPRAGLRGVLGEHLPQRLAAALAPEDGRPVGEWPDRALAEVAQRLGDWRLNPSGTEGYAKAEVTRGGVATQGLSSRTMEAREVPGLFVIGEAVDVTGWLGGYNFQWAWSSGRAAGESA